MFYVITGSTTGFPKSDQHLGSSVGFGGRNDVSSASYCNLAISECKTLCIPVALLYNLVACIVLDLIL